MENNKITDETLEYIGILSKLEIQEEEKGKTVDDLEKMLAYVDQLKKVDTSGIEPMSHVMEMKNVLREDEVINGDESGELLLNAPKKQDGMFVVPKTFG